MKPSPLGVVIERKWWSSVAMRLVRSRCESATREALTRPANGLAAPGGQHVVEFGEGERRGDEIVVERGHPVGHGAVVGFAGVVERQHHGAVQNDAQSSPKPLSVR